MNSNSQLQRRSELDNVTDSAAPLSSKTRAEERESLREKRSFTGPELGALIEEGSMIGAHQVQRSFAGERSALIQANVLALLRKGDSNGARRI